MPKMGGLQHECTSLLFHTCEISCYALLIWFHAHRISSHARVHRCSGNASWLLLPVSHTMLLRACRERLAWDQCRHGWANSPHLRHIINANACPAAIACRAFPLTVPTVYRILRTTKRADLTPT